MLSNTCDAKRIYRLLELFIVIFVIIVVIRICLVYPKSRPIRSSEAASSITGIT